MAEDKLNVFVDAVKTALAGNKTLTDEYKKSVEDGLKANVIDTMTSNLTTRSINAAAGVFAEQAIAKFDPTKAVETTVLKELVDNASFAIFSKHRLKEIATHPTGDGVAQKSFIEDIFNKAPEAVKAIANSFEKSSTPVKVATAAIGGFVVFNRIKAMFTTTEVMNEETKEFEKKGTSFLSKFANLAIAVGVAVVGYKVVGKGESYGKVGEDIGNTWAKYVTNRGKTLSFGVGGVQ